MKTQANIRRKQPNWRFSRRRQLSLKKAQARHVYYVILGREAFNKKGRKTVQQVKEN